MHLKFTLISCSIVVGLFLAMVALLEGGRRLWNRRSQRIGELGAGVGPLNAAVFALLGLLLALLFTSAGQRFDWRRELIVQETNAIGTAYKRLDLLPADAQPAIRDLFRRYVDARLAIYENLDDEAGTPARLQAVTTLQDEIWSATVAASRRDGVPTSTAMLLVPALNEMIDLTTTRIAATMMHAPGLIFVFVIGLALSSALLAGYASGSGPRDWLHNVTFAAAISVTMYVIIDLEFPRLGLITIGGFDHLMSDLRASMK